MRKLLVCLMVFTMLAGCIPACLADSPFPSLIRPQERASEPAADDDTLIRAALQTLRAAWQKEYSSGKYYCSGEHLIDIRGTRLIRIKKTLEEREAKTFSDIACIIEFLMYDDYYATEVSGHGVGYYDVSLTRNCVVVHRSGYMESVSRSPLILYSGRTYVYDYTPLVEEVIDFRDRYNQVFTFTVH